MSHRIIRNFAVGFLVLVTVLAGAGHAQSDRQWHKTYTLQGAPQLRIRTSDGNVIISTWERNEVEATVDTIGWKIAPNGIQIIEHQEGDRVELEVRYPHPHFSITFGGPLRRRVEITVHMPKHGAVEVHSSDGNVEVTGLHGDITLSTGDGHVTVEEVDGNLRASSGDGHVRARGRFDLLQIKTGDGHVEATVLPGSQVKGPWELHTGDGSVILYLPVDFSADLDMNTSDGRILTELPLEVSGQLGKSHMRGKLNRGGGLFTVHTGDGSIRLEKYESSV